MLRSSVMERAAFLGGVFLIAILFPFPTLAAREAAPILYTGEKYRDPTGSPLSSTLIDSTKDGVVSLPHLEIQGIIWGERNPRAIVNNQVVGKGDFVAGVEILEVSQKGVRIFFQGTSHFLKPGGGVEEKP